MADIQNLIWILIMFRSPDVGPQFSSGFYCGPTDPIMDSASSEFKIHVFKNLC